MTLSLHFAAAGLPVACSLHLAAAGPPVTFSLHLAAAGHPRPDPRPAGPTPQVRGAGAGAVRALHAVRAAVTARHAAEGAHVQVEAQARPHHALYRPEVGAQLAQGGVRDDPRIDLTRYGYGYEKV